MKMILKIAAWVVGVIIYFALVDVALNLVSQPSDACLALGVVMIAVLLGVLIFTVSRLISRAKKQASKTFRHTRMKSVFILLFASSLAFLGSGCGKRVGPGMAGLKVDLYGKNRGVQDCPLVTGMVWYNPFTTEVIEYPCFVQTAAWTGEEELTFNTKDGMVVHAKISLSYQLAMESAPSFYVKFRTENITAFTHGFMHNTARDAFNEIAATYTVEDVYGPKKQDLLALVQTRINTNMAPYGIHIEQLGFLDALGIPQQVTDALNGKIKAQQDAMRVENEIQQAQAEAKKVVAKANGDAEANERLAKSITPELLAWQQLQLQQAAITKWDGKRPMVEGGGNGNGLGMGMLMQLPPSTAK